MNYKPDEKDWMAYLYGEAEGEEKVKIDQYLLENAEARKEFEKFQSLRKIMSSVEDKEVIAPPIIIEGSRQRFLWNTPYLRMIVSIAASLLLIILVGSLTGTRISLNGNEFKLSFGEEQPAKSAPVVIEKQVPAELTAEQVQQMINESLTANNSAIESTWKKSQEKLTASIRENLAVNSAKVDEVLKTASLATQEQISNYVATLQAENMQQVKDYFQLTSAQQKTYIESLLVDFDKYLQQQRNNDLQLVQTRLHSIEENSNVFRQETEQILTSIISSVGPQNTTEKKN
ncbi:MAG TPA: hypothetical protein VGD40_21410 [Chryseosolibacter sp.]